MGLEINQSCAGAKGAWAKAQQSFLPQVRCFIVDTNLKASLNCRKLYGPVKQQKLSDWANLEDWPNLSINFSWLWGTNAKQQKSHLIITGWKSYDNADGSSGKTRKQARVLVIPCPG